MTAADEPVELACTLTADEHAARIAWIQELNATALIGYHRDGHRIRLEYRPEAAAQAREFVRGERRCCPFLRFASEEHPDAFVVTIDAPPELDTVADELFAGYVRGEKR
ncbi:hypothetical protein [Mycobacterium interjectum]|uniref:hypothetical protein n=1 Tax=Mycobacterium interjectum TaxID=33895 RepID=UPI00083430E2|nr:hypothetical protein [Mycobacterium interjectum]